MELTNTQARKNNLSKSQKYIYDSLDSVLEVHYMSLVDVDDLIEVLAVLHNEYLEEAGIDEDGGDYL